MSSVSNVQNLLANVFRPTYLYNTTTSNYQTKLELVNIDTVSANVVSTFAATVGDASGNVYVGIGAGNSHSTLGASSNTTDTFVGTGAGGATLNVKNSVFLGYRAGYGVSNSSNSISIGTNTLNGGNSNIYIGCATGIATGSNNIFLGTGLSNGNTSASNLLLIGSGSNTTICGDLSNNRIGVNMSSLSDPSSRIVFDVSGYSRISGPSNTGGLGINIDPGEYTLDVNGNMRASDGWASLVMSHVNNDATLTFSNVRPGYSNATIQSTGGFYSLTGSIVISGNTTSNIGVFKKGVVLVSASSDTGALAIHAARQYDVSISNDGTTYAVGSMASFNVGASISNSTSNITLSNGYAGTLTYTYSITYFPRP